MNLGVILSDMERALEGKSCHGFSNEVQDWERKSEKRSNKRGIATLNGFSALGEAEAGMFACAFARLPRNISVDRTQCAFVCAKTTWNQSTRVPALTLANGICKLRKCNTVTQLWLAGYTLPVFLIYKQSGLSHAALINNTNAIPLAIGNPFVMLTRRSVTF